MKNTIVKYKGTIIALLMIVLNSAGAFASAPWTVNPSDYRYDMSLYLDVSFATEPMDYSQYEVGVFCGDECRGVAEVLNLSNGKSCLYVRVRSNEESGETMTFKYYDKDTEEISVIDGASFTFESNGRLGYPSDPYKVVITIHYDVTLTAGIGGSVDQEGGRLAEGTVITVTATPAEGYHFEKWSDDSTENPRTITVDSNIDLEAEFAVNQYTLTYTVDGESYKVMTVDYGTAIVAEAEPVKEGHSFSGWEGLPETMPAHDVTVTGTFSINSYNAVFKIGDEIVETKSVEFGAEVVAPDAPAKEGYTFDGWQEVPATMPAHDVEILGSYTVNQYTLTYTVDGESYKVITVDYGTAIVAEAEPVKEGHSFSGWEGLPETMPAHNVTVTGTFTVNTYTLTLYLNNVIYSTEEVEFGTALNIGEPEVPSGNRFEGWATEIPETMPAYDLEIYGTYSALTSIETIAMERDGKVTIYTLTGIMICKDKEWSEISTTIPAGVYIVNGNKVILQK